MSELTATQDDSTQESFTCLPYIQGTPNKVKNEETNRVWHSTWLEYKPRTRKQLKSAIKEHAECTRHNVTSTNATIMEKGLFNLKKRKFLEAIHSCRIMTQLTNK